MIETRGASRIRPLGLVPSSFRADIPPEGWEVLSNANKPGARPMSAVIKPCGRGSVGSGGWRRLRRRSSISQIEHLEGALEGLQDAVYRQAVPEKEKLGEVCKRIAPGQMARELSRDARRRGL